MFSFVESQGSTLCYGKPCARSYIGPFLSYVFVVRVWEWGGPKRCRQIMSLSGEGA